MLRACFRFDFIPAAGPYRDAGKAEGDKPKAPLIFFVG
jgi:hypothetical protein